MSWDALRAIRDSALPATQRAVAHNVVLRAGDDGCWASQATIAADTGLGERTVRRDLTILVEAGVLSAIERPGRTTVYAFFGVAARPSTAPAPHARVRGVEDGTPRHHVPPTPAPRAGTPAPRADEMPSEIPLGNEDPLPPTPSPRGEGAVRGDKPERPSDDAGADRRAVWVARWAQWSVVDLERRGDHRQAEQFRRDLEAPPAAVVDRARSLIAGQRQPDGTRRRALPGQPEAIRRRDIVRGLRLASEWLARGPPPDLPTELADHLRQPPPGAPT